ncbi:unnamed protein product [Bursaphelenchus xylophilus]|uniref:(pine wood nematode) hypothetical protein n=1 Tax=Bursaphelenchus xylophilus TaxID=6326 RepID=A0A7I8WIB0_BURXY|nr:unnamed protein product [Bursaphelenchus xylophilus]CAG9108956.1 unnamed protein product [Bursaphelenchus xylophilus]
MKRHYDEPNPFLPDIKRTMEKVPDAGQKQIVRFKRNFVSLDAYTRHKMMVNTYLLNVKGATNTLQRDSSKDKGVYDVVKENHRFLWGDEDLTDVAKNWDKQLAKRYYDKLYKEYCIADLSKFEKNKIGLRWRTEKEVVNGKGQFECGGKHCEKKKKLTSWEVNFAYEEHGEKKNALVKVRLCPECSLKLNFFSKKKKIKKEKEKRKKKHKKRRRESSSESTSEAEEPSSSQAKIKEEVDDIRKGEHQNKKVDDEAEEIWSKPVSVNEEEPSVEDDMESFFDDLLL